MNYILFSKLYKIIIISFYSFLLQRMKSVDECKGLQRKSKPQKQVFDSVLQKHFQIIQTFLDKINVLYLKNQELEISYNNMAQKISQIQESTSNIHYEFRTTHLHIDKKINHMNHYYRNIQQQLAMIREDLPYDKSLQSMRFASKSAHLKCRNRKTSFTNGLAIQINKGNSLEHENSQQQYVDVQSENSDFIYNCSSPQSIQTQAKINSQGPNQQRIYDNTKSPSNFFSSPLPSLNLQASQKIIQGMISKYFQDYFKECPESLHNIITNKFLHFSIGLQQRLQDKVKKSVEFGIEKWGKGLNEQFQLEKTNRIKLQQKVEVMLQALKRQSRERFDKQIKKIDLEFITIKQSVSRLNLTRIERQIEGLKQNLFKNVGILEERINSKVQLAYFQQSMNNLSATVSFQLNNIHKFMPNRLETHKAINFLQKKINRLIEGLKVDQKQLKTKKQIEEGPLRIHRCDSQKKMQAASERSIKDRCFDELDRNCYKSLNSSFLEKEVEPSHSNSQLTQIKCQIDWKKSYPPNFQKFKQSSQVKNSITKTGKIRPSYSNQSSGINSQDKQMNVKQWRDKVVRVLNIGDRKRMKVTFR